MKAQTKYPNKYKKTSLNLRIDLHKAGKQAAIHRDINFQDWLGEAINEKLLREEGKIENTQY